MGISLFLRQGLNRRAEYGTKGMFGVPQAPRVWKRRLRRERRARQKKQGSHKPCTNHKGSNVFDSIFYNDMGSILEYSQRGECGTVREEVENPSRKITHAWFRELVQHGWRPAYVLKTFRYMNDVLIMNWPERLLTDDLFRLLIRQQGWLGSLRASLYGIGLRSAVADHLDRILGPLVGSGYTHIQVMDKAIDWLQRYERPIRSAMRGHPLPPEDVGRWVDRAYRSKVMKVFCLPVSCEDEGAERACEEALATGFAGVEAEEDYEYYYHGTSWRHSFRMMDGMSRYIGTRCMDFGVYPGIHVFPAIGDCISWCVANRLRWSGETAVLVFRLPKDVLSSDTTKCLEGDEWSAITCKTRQGPYDNELREIRDYDFIYGDQVANADAVVAGTEEARPHDPPRKQLVGCSDVADKILHRGLVGCLYFQKKRV